MHYGERTSETTSNLFTKALEQGASWGVGEKTYIRELMKYKYPESVVLCSWKVREEENWVSFPISLGAVGYGLSQNASQSNLAL